MRSIKLTSFFTSLAVCLAATASALSQANRNYPRDQVGILKGSSAPCPLDDPQLRIVLGKVLEVSYPSPDVVEITLVNLFEYRESIPQGDSIKVQVQVPRVPSRQGPGPLNPELLARGADVLVPIFNIEQLQHWAGRKFNVMGLAIPCAVRREDVPLIKPAMAKLGAISKHVDFMLTNDEAEELFRVEDNYFVWALGATALAAQNDEGAAVGKLAARCTSRDQQLLSPRQVVWLYHCIGDVALVGLSGGLTRQDLLIGYLECLSEIMPDTMPPPATQP